MAQRYICTLSREVQESANKELNEPLNNKDRLKAIDDLRHEFKKKNPNIKLIREDDKFLLRFLRGAYFQINQAIDTLKHFHLLKTEWPEVYDKVKNPQQLDEILCEGVVCPLQGRAKNGAAIIVARPELRHYSQPVDVMAATWKIVNMLLEDEYTQIYGIVIIKDFSNLKIFDSDSFQNIVVNIKTPLQMAESLHKGIPGRIAAVNFTNQPAIFDLVYCMLLPCFDESTNNRFFVHGEDFSLLHESIEQSILPQMFEGSGPEIDVEGWKQQVISDSSLGI